MDWKGEGDVRGGWNEERKGKEIGRKVWREKNLLLLLRMLDGRVDRHGLMALIK